MRTYTTKLALELYYLQVHEIPCSGDALTQGWGTAALAEQAKGGQLQGRRPLSEAEDPS